MGRCRVLFCLALCVVTLARASTKDNQVLEESSSHGDVYLDRVHDECTVSRSPFKCFKYKALKYLHKWTTEDRKVSTSLWGPISIITTPASSIPMFADSQPRSTDTELEQIEKYAHRQLERYVSTHAMLWTLPSGLGGARLVDDGENVAADAEEGRGRRKKKLSILLPLLLFMKLKAMLIPILLIVIFIKKMLVVGAFLAPSFLAQLKQKEHHATAHEHGHHDSNEWGGGYGVDSYGRIGKRDAQELAYHGYKKT